MPESNTKQATRSGKNLFDIDAELFGGKINKYNNGFRLSKDDDYRTLSIKLPKPIPAGAYKVTYDIVAKTTEQRVQVSFRTDTGSLEYGNIQDTGETDITLSGEATRMYIYISTAEPDDNYIILDNFMVSTEGGEYEEYGAMPSPEFPSPIQNVSGDVNVTVVNENFNRFPYQETTKTSGGLTWTVNDDGTILVNGTNTSGSTQYFILHGLIDGGNYLKEGEYTMSLGSSSNVRATLATYDTNTTIAGINANQSSRSFSLTQNTNCRLTLAVNSGLSVNNVLIKPSIQLGATEKPYVEHQEQELWLDLGGKNKYSGHTKGIGLNPTTGAEITENTRATSDFISVDFAKNPNYVISGMPNTLYNFVGAYNANKQFLGRTSAGATQERTLSSTVFTAGTAQGTGDIAYLRTTFYEASGLTGKIDDIDNAEIQLEIGTEPSEHYSPYIENPIELCKSKTGDYQDYPHKVEGKWYKHEAIKKLNTLYVNGFASAEGEVESNCVGGYRPITNILNDVISTANIVEVSDKFKYELWNGTKASTSKIILRDNAFIVVVEKSILASLGYEENITGLNNYIRDTEIITYYAVANPQEIEITNTHQIEQLEAIAKATSYKGTTHIYSTNDLSPIFDVTALGRAN